MTKTTKNVRSSKNSSSSTSVKNVVTENSATSVQVETMEKTQELEKKILLADSLSALSSVSSSSAGGSPLKDSSLSVYDSPQKSAIIEQIKMHFKEDSPTFEYKLEFCYKSDSLAGWSDVFGGLKDSPYIDQNLISALGLGGCLSLWFARLPLADSNKVRKFVNEFAPSEKYKDCTFDNLCDYIEKNHKDLLNVLGVSKLRLSDLEVDNKVVAWYDNNTSGKYTYYSDGLYYSVVADSIPGWLSAISSLSVRVAWKLLRVRNKLSEQRYNSDSVRNYLLDVLRSGCSPAALLSLAKSACNMYNQELADKEETEKEVLINRRLALIHQIMLETDNNKMFANKLKHFNWLSSYLGGLEMIRHARAVYSDVFLYSVDEIYKYYSPLYSKTAHKKTASGLKKSDSVLRTLRNSLAKVEKELDKLNKK